MNWSYFKPEHKKFAFLLVFIIAGALVVSWGFNHIQSQQAKQNTFSHQLERTKESQRSACHAANVLRANTNVNAYAEYRAWVFVGKFPEAKRFVAGALKGVLDQTWIPLTNCSVTPHGVEGYPIPSAVKFSVRPPSHSALTVAPEDP